MPSASPLAIHRSNRADRLARELAETIRVPVAGPFVPERIVVSGRAAERWVALHVAQTLGVAANLRMLSPTSLLEESLTAILGDEAAGLDGWRAERLGWAVHAMLPSFAGDAAFAPVTRYLADGGRAGSARAMALAQRIGQTFDRYATTRPDMVLAWDAGASADEPWQPVLWRGLRTRLAVPHPAELTRRAVARLAAGDAAAEQLPARLTWFTHGSVPKLHLELLQALAAAGTRVHLFVLSPSQALVRRVTEHAMDLTGGDAHPAVPAPVRFGNALTESLGRQARDFEILLAAQGLHDAREIDHYEEPRAATMLGALQRDVMACRTPPAVDRTEVQEDGSIRVHACHGALRQVEVLRDELLRCFDEIPGLQPRDVVVLTPDVASFAPLVDAVFSTAATSPDAAPAIPFRIADRPVRQDNPVADALLRVLALVDGRCDAATVLDLLTTPVIARRFALDDVASDVLQRWIGESGIRWGVDAEHRERHGLPPVAENTWRFGIDRLLVGQAMPGDGRELFEGVLPYDEIEGREAELLGCVAEACARLFGAVRDLATPRTMAAWSDALLALADGLVDVEDDAIAWPLQTWRAAQFALAEDARVAGNDALLELAAVRGLLEERFGESSTASGFGTGAVTFCALRPGRTVTARVVALLGMDDKAFPRQRGAAGFDLAARQPRVGDVDPNADDRQRFLEALMGAGDRLVVTHTGRSLATNEVVPPAVPVAELLDVIDATFVVPGNGAAVKARSLVERAHPLQPFNPACFRAAAGEAGAEPPSFDATYLAAARRLLDARRVGHPFIGRPLPPLAAAGGTDRVITIDELARFFAGPAKALLSTRLGLGLGARDAAVEIREPVRLDSIASWALRGALLRQLLDGEDPKRAYTAIRASGVLPHGAMGELTFEQACEEAAAIHRAVVAEWDEATPCDPLAVDLELDGTRIVGRIDALCEHGRIRHQPGAAQDRHVVEEWVRHLVLCAAADREQRSTIVGLPVNKKNVTRFEHVPEARDRLIGLLALHAAGQARPLPFFPETSKAFTKALAKHGADGWPDVLKSTRSAWARASAFVEKRYESECPYVRRAFGDAEPFADGHREDSPFRMAAVGIWTPLLDRMTQVTV